jgi:hypothetical protein
MPPKSDRLLRGSEMTRRASFDQSGFTAQVAQATIAAKAYSRGAK